MADAVPNDLAHLLVDARPVCHPTAGSRGIGRYTVGLLDGLQQIGAPVIALYETDAEAALLATAIPGLELAPLRPATVRRFTEPNTWFLATQLMLHPIPLDPVPHIITESGLPVAAVMYDVIPERHPLQYQVRPPARAQVLLRGMLTRTLDALLAISDFSADTAADELHFPRNRIATIGAGCDRHFIRTDDDPWPLLTNVLPDESPNNPRSLVINVAGGSDPRKNVERLLQAWGLLPASVRRTHRLVVVGTFDDRLRQQWSHWANEAGVADEVVFTGSVSDAELVALHQAATLAVVPSIEEGFGLPVLEAAACGCPVVTSNVSALPEVLAEQAAQFDPLDVHSIASAIMRALTDVGHRELLIAAANRAAVRWTWAHTGRAVVESLQQLGPRKQRTLRPVRHRVAMVGRFDDSPEGHANTELAHAMAGQSPAPEVTLLVDNGGWPTPTRGGPLRFPSRALGRFVPRSQFDDVITLPAES